MHHASTARSNVLKLALVAGFCLLLGLNLPSPWRPSLPEPQGDLISTTHTHSQAAAGATHAQSQAAATPACTCTSGSESCCPPEKKKGEQLVRVDVYGESLCPDTTHAINDVLGPLFENGIASIMHLRYFAYGKVHETSSGLQCQHGPKECLINRWLNCAQALHPDQKDWYPYAACVHGNGARSIEGKAREECPAARGWNKEELAQCATGPKGEELEKKAGEATKALGSLSFVPWILVNDAAMGYDFEPLAQKVCAAYTGDKRPAACASA